MVMKKMREHTKTFLIILVAAFIGTIVFDWGMNITGLRQQPNVMGKVNGEKIMADKYYQAIQNQINYQREQGVEDLSDAQIAQIENQVWQGMVEEILMRQEIERRGITATDSEIVAILKYSPPPALRQNESFQTNGIFDFKKYQAALRDPRNDWRPIENYVRNMLPFQKLQEQITASVFVTPEEVRWEYIKQNEKAKVKYIFFDVNSVSNEEIQVSEKEISNYYNEHKETYREPEKRKLDYVIFPIVPTAYDSQAVWEDAEDLLKQLKEGKDFATLAEQFSEDVGSREKGGDLGYFGKGTMVKEFEDAAFNAKVGEIVGPVKSNFGLHIIKVEDRKKENGEIQIKARHILLRFTPSNQTIGDIRTKASLFAMDALEQGFPNAAQKDSLKIESTPLFVESGFIPGIGFSSDLMKFTFSGSEGDITEEPVETDRGFIVAQITQVQSARIRPLEEVKTSIQNILMREKKLAKIGQKCAEIRQQMSVPDDFEQVAVRDSLKIETTDFFTRASYIPNVGREPEFIGAAFALDINKISQPLKGSRGYYLIKLVEKVPIDEADFENQKAAIRQRLLAQKRSQAFTDWLNALKQKAEIKDFRKRMA